MGIISARFDWRNHQNLFVKITTEKEGEEINPSKTDQRRVGRFGIYSGSNRTTPAFQQDETLMFKKRLSASFSFVHQLGSATATLPFSTATHVVGLRVLLERQGTAGGAALERVQQLVPGAVL